MKFKVFLSKFSQRQAADPINVSRTTSPPPRQNPTATPTGTAFLDQARFHAYELEMHYIGSMLFAFNFAEEVLNQSGAGVRVVKSLAEDLVSWTMVLLDLHRDVELTFNTGSWELCTCNRRRYTHLSELCFPTWH